MNPEKITGFENYTPEVVYVLRGLFGQGIIDSRPMILDNVVLWVDAEERLHRHKLPAVENKNGNKEFWEHGNKLKI